MEQMRDQRTIGKALRSSSMGLVLVGILVVGSESDASLLLPETGQSFFTDSLMSRKRRSSHKEPQYGLRSPAWSLLFPQADMAFLRSPGRADHPLLQGVQARERGINHRRLLALRITLWT